MTQAEFEQKARVWVRGKCMTLAAFKRRLAVARKVFGAVTV